MHTDDFLSLFDDENTKYNVDVLKKFIDNKNDFGFIAKINNKIVGFAFWIYSFETRWKKSILS